MRSSFFSFSLRFGMYLLKSLNLGTNISRVTVRSSSLSDALISNKSSLLLSEEEPVDKKGSYCAASTGSLELISLTILSAAKIMRGINAATRTDGIEIVKVINTLNVGSGDDVGHGVGSGVFVGNNVLGNGVLRGVLKGVGLKVSVIVGQNVLVGINVLVGGGEGVGDLFGVLAG